MWTVTKNQDVLNICRKASASYDKTHVSWSPPKNRSKGRIHCGKNLCPRNHPQAE